MRLIRNLLRVYSYLFEAVLSLAALAVSIVILLSPHSEVRMAWLPWAPEKTGIWLLAIGVSGIVLVVLAILGQLRLLLMLFALAMLLLITRGLFFSSWRFSGAGEFRSALWLVLAMLAAFIGAIPISREEDASGYRRSRSR